MAETIVERHKIVLLEHELIVGGNLLRETKQFATVTAEDPDANEETTLIHTRIIGSRMYQVKEVRVSNVTMETQVDTAIDGAGNKKRPMVDSEMKKFKDDWLRMWNPTITDEQATEAAEPPKP